MQKSAIRATLAVWCLSLLGAAAMAADPSQHAWRASDLIGMKIRNSANQDLGKVDDLVIDTKTGKVRYAGRLSCQRILRSAAANPTIIVLQRSRATSLPAVHE